MIEAADLGRAGLLAVEAFDDGFRLSAEVVEGRASPKANNPWAAAVPDTEPKCRVDPNDGCAAGDERD